MDIEPGRFAVVTDPAGAVFNVITLNPEHIAVARRRDSLALTKI